MSHEQQQDGGAGPSHRSVEVLVALIIALLAIIGIIGSLEAGIDWASDGPRAGFFPFYVSVIVLGSTVINLYGIAQGDARRIFAEWPKLRQVMAVVAPATAYVLLVPVLGMYVSSALLIGVFMRWLGGYRWPLVLVIAIGVPLITFLMFERWFLVPLPKGPLEDLLGL